MLTWKQFAIKRNTKIQVNHCPIPNRLVVIEYSVVFKHIGLCLTIYMTNYARPQDWA